MADSGQIAPDASSLIVRSGGERSLEAVRAAAPYHPSVTDKIRSDLARCPAYRPTPLVTLDGLASTLGIAALCVKDERSRMGLSAFKAVGGVFAVLEVARQAAVVNGEIASIADLVRRRSASVKGLTFAAATAGNHGAAVAAGASLIGSRSVIFIYDGVSKVQERAIARLGAEIVHIEGGYDLAVERCRETCEREGWIVIADTGWTGYEAVPKLIMQGYTVISSEIFDQVSRPPTHLFVQAGVGGLAAAVAGHSSAIRPHSPKVIVVEPDAAAPLFASAVKGDLVDVPAFRGTSMGRLQCYVASPPAWDVLKHHAFAFLTVSDAEAAEAQAVLAQSDLETSATGAAGLAGLLRVAASDQDRARLGIDSSSVISLIVTEAEPGPASNSEAESMLRLAGGESSRA